MPKLFRKKRSIFTKLLLSSLFSFLFLLLFTSSSHAATYYIAPNGSDNSNGSINSPWKTWTHADGYLRPGDTLYARGGTYDGQGGSWDSLSGTSSAPITFAAYPGEKPIFDGGGASKMFIFVTQKDWLVFDGLTIKNYNSWAAIMLGSGSGANRANYITIKNSSFIDNGDHQLWEHAIYAQYGSSNLDIHNNLIINSSASGIAMGHTPAPKNVLIYNNIIKDSNIAMVFNSGAENIKIYNNTLINNNRGIDLTLEGADAGDSGGVFNAVIRNNISYVNPGQYGIGVGSFNINDVDLDYNLWYHSGVGGKPILWGSNYYTVEELRNNTDNADHSIQANPLFINIVGGDFHLQSGSPARDAGAALGEVPIDFDGVSRPQGAGYDIGAYEYLGGIQPSPSPSPSPTPTPPSPSSSCLADINNDNTVNLADIIQILQAWGSCPGCAEDVDGNGFVNVADIISVLQAWGKCP